MTLPPICDDVFAVIVTFNPDLTVLDALVQRLLPQVGAAMIVDNGSATDVAAWHAQREYAARVQLQLVGENLGIAAAQNIGIAEASRRGASYVLLSDQDSQPAVDMVFQLRKTILELTAEGAKVAAVGPRYLIDERRDEPPPFVQVQGLRVTRQVCRDTDSVVEVDYVISSGCLIPIEAAKAVGPMKEEMFIDYVDIEWGLRARQRGYRSYGVCAAAMTHSIGDSPITLMGRRYLLHSPLRHYYHFRNAAWLYKQKYVPLQWKVADGMRLATRYFFYTMFARPRRSHCRMMTIGLFDGVRSRLGRCEVT
jgi:rhamnosyltransferase